MPLLALMIAITRQGSMPYHHEWDAGSPVVVEQPNNFDISIFDAFTRENLLLKTRPSIRSGYLLRELQWLFLDHGKPAKLWFDNGPEFRSTRLTSWLAMQGVVTGFIEPGSPLQSGHIESFFGKLRDELLNMEIFPTGADL